MIFRRLAYGFKEGLKNIFRNKIFSLATVGTIMACIFLLGVTFSVLLNVRATVKQAEDSVTISVFFDEKLPEGGKDAIGKKIKSYKEVQSVRYVSAEEAWAKYKKEVFKNNEDLLEGFEGKNPLNESDSYEVMLKDVKYHGKMVKQFKGLDGVRKVEYAKGAAEGISKANLLGSLRSRGYYPDSFACVGLPREQHRLYRYCGEKRRDRHYETDRCHQPIYQGSIYCGGSRHRDRRLPDPDGRHLYRI